MVELGQPPVDEPELACRVVDEDVEGLDVAVDDALGVAKVERFQQLVHVVALGV